ncbi:MAG: hypothetical protein ACP5N0_02115 [Methanosarcina sp.]|jgi:hypothetical protein
MFAEKGKVQNKIFYECPEIYEIRDEIFQGYTEKGSGWNKAFKIGKNFS